MIGIICEFVNKRVVYRDALVAHLRDEVESAPVSCCCWWMDRYRPCYCLAMNERSGIILMRRRVDILWLDVVEVGCRQATRTLHVGAPICVWGRILYLLRRILRVLLPVILLITGRLILPVMRHAQFTDFGSVIVLLMDVFIFDRRRRYGEESKILIG